MIQTQPLDGNAVVYCEGSFNTPNGKTAHGLVRHTRRYRVLSVIDSRQQGRDAAEVLDGKAKGIPVVSSLKEALNHAKVKSLPVDFFVIGLAPDGGRMDEPARQTVKEAIGAGLHVDSGLHDFLTENPEFVDLAQKHGVQLRDIRKTPGREMLHFFTGKIEEVTALKVAILGTDSAIGKRTTAWVLVDALNRAGIATELVGTGQTAWLQGAKYCLILDSLINDFVSGEIEHNTWSAWKDGGARVVVIEGQGSLLNPAYPGGFEILAAARPDLVILQHAPRRKEYDGFPGYFIHPLEKQIEAIQCISDCPVAAVTINHEEMTAEEVRQECRELSAKLGMPVVDVLLDGAGALVPVIKEKLK
jgi:uncharacterized NAD-dependent epimerase/dehydratase family protein